LFAPRPLSFLWKGVFHSLKERTRQLNFLIKRGILPVFALCCALTGASRVTCGQTHPDSTLVVRKIDVLGNEQTKEQIIRREMSIAVGSVLTSDAVEHDLQRIYSLGLFNRVEIDSVVDGKHVDLSVVVHERWYVFPFPILGIKYRNPKNLYYGGGLTHQNFRGRNEKLWFSFALGFDRWVQLGYQNPKLTPGDDLFLRSYVRYGRIRSLSTTEELYDQTQLTAQLTMGKRFGLYRWLMGWINYDVWQVSEARLGRTVSPSGRDAYITLGVQVSVDTRDLHEYATRGTLASVSASKYGLGESDVDFYKLGYDLRKFFSLVGDLTLGVRTFGTFSGGGIIPPYRHEYFGYNERVRGYFSNVFEGEHILGNSAELRFPILKPRYYNFPYSFLPEFSVWRFGVYAGLFADVGRIWYRQEPLSSRGWKSGVGGGIHFLLPYSIVARTEYAVNNEWRGQVFVDFGVSF
jgi:outer membrane protein insertion porin family